MNEYQIQQILGDCLNQGENVEIIDIEKVLGGDINNSILIRSDKGNYFMKYPNNFDLNQFYEFEFKGLELIRQSDFIVPKVYSWSDGLPHILLEYIEETKSHHFSPRDFVNCLTSLHEYKGDCFGLPDSNYIGKLVQDNDPRDTWEAFYIENRLLPQVKLARENGVITSGEVSFIERIYLQIGRLFPTEKPSLVHGDLWNGNAFFDQEKRPVLFDPAAHFGNREMDLGMMKLFGGFPDEVYEMYHEALPLEENWEDRIPLTQLYPLLVHVNLFGRVYLEQLKVALKYFV